LTRFKDTRNSWQIYDDLIAEAITNVKCKNILEIGAGKEPTLKDVPEHINYTISDKDIEEIVISEKKGLTIIHADFESKQLKLTEKYDLIISKMVMEHVKDQHTFHKNVLKALNKEGMAIHFFATRYSVPMILNVLLPERFTDWILFKFQTRVKEKHDKFKAYYNWCYGPTKKNSDRLESIGYKISKYEGFIGHHYTNRFPILHFFEIQWNSLNRWIGSPYLCANAYFIAKKR
jgi:2-polyprenyl-3-methyl-5-hydroxy-6-metoxy-1,4-benzoquinol methylase